MYAEKEYTYLSLDMLQFTYVCFCVFIMINGNCIAEQ